MFQKLIKKLTQKSLYIVQNIEHREHRERNYKMTNFISSIRTSLSNYKTEDSYASIAPFTPKREKISRQSTPEAPMKKKRRYTEQFDENPLHKPFRRVKKSMFPQTLEEAYGIKTVTRRSPPPFAIPDMAYGLESVSCELAIYFYLQHRNTLIHMVRRKDVETLYMKTWSQWCPLHLRTAPRHTTQIIFSLSNYMRACRVLGGKIEWYTVINPPQVPQGYPNQIHVHRNVTMTRGVAKQTNPELYFN